MVTVAQQDKNVIAVLGNIILHAYVAPHGSQAVTEGPAGYLWDV
jgi:hypothetical protein